MAEINSDDLISHLMIAHFSSELQSYHRNLTSAVHIATSKWLPDIDDPIAARHAETLREYLAANGATEVDAFLLRLGLTIPGVQRGIIPPLLVLEPNRGGFSTKRQREAAGQVIRLREALALGRKFHPSLNSDPKTAIVELAELCQFQRRPHDAEWLELFGQLSDVEAERLVAQAIESFDSDEKSVRAVGERALHHLACFRQSPLSEATCLALIEREIFWPSSLYRQTGERPAEQLVKLIRRAGDLATLNHLLLALAWTRSTIAEQFFRDWALHPPDWAENLHVAPAEYLPAAGWCLYENGQARDLVSIKSFRLRPSAEGASVISARTQLDESCPFCGSRLMHLFDFSRAGSILKELGIVEAPTAVPCCFSCSCYEPVFARYPSDGPTKIISTIEPGGRSYAGESKLGSRYLTAVPCPAFACAEMSSLEDASTLGGVPTTAAASAAVASTSLGKLANCCTAKAVCPDILQTDLFRAEPRSTPVQPPRVVLVCSAIGRFSRAICAASILAL